MHFYQPNTVFGMPRPSVESFGLDHDFVKPRDDKVQQKAKVNNDADFKKLYEESVKMN